MKTWIWNNRLIFIGALIGGLAGFLYWKWVGCASGTCQISSKPLNSTLYFGFMGAVFFSLFSNPNKKQA